MTCFYFNIEHGQKHLIQPYLSRQLFLQLLFLAPNQFIYFQEDN